MKIPEDQARQMGQLLGSRNFSLTLQFIQAAGQSGSLVSVYSGQSEYRKTDYATSFVYF